LALFWGEFGNSLWFPGDGVELDVRGTFVNRNSFATYLSLSFYLENIFELGWPIAVILFLCVAWLTRRCFSGARNRGRDWVYPATGVAATVLVAIHSIVDFSLQIPGIAITYACILGVACAQSYSSR
jgi:hypothetical protein